MRNQLDVNYLKYRKNFRLTVFTCSGINIARPNDKRVVYFFENLIPLKMRFIWFNRDHPSITKITSYLRTLRRASMNARGRIDFHNLEVTGTQLRRILSAM